MSDETMDEGSFCIPNIGPKERQKRVRFGIVALVVTGAAAAAMFAMHAPRFSRAFLFLPLAGAMTGFLQAREKT